jgi:hypothetical protein
MKSANQSIPQLAPLPDLVKQTERCLHYIAERNSYQDHELLLLLELCTHLPSNVIYRCPQIKEILVLKNDYRILDDSTRMAIPGWIMEDLALLGYKTPSAN